MAGGLIIYQHLAFSCQVSLLRLPEAPSGSASADSDASGPLRGGVRRRHGQGRLPRVRTPTAASDGDSSDAGSSVKVSPSLLRMQG